MCHSRKQFVWGPLGTGSTPVEWWPRSVEPDRRSMVLRGRLATCQSLIPTAGRKRFVSGGGRREEWGGGDLLARPSLKGGSCELRRSLSMFDTYCSRGE